MERPALTEGDDSFARFYESSRDQLARAVWAATGDRDLAADAVDEAFARAYARWSEIAPLANPQGWIFRTALNWATSRYRKLASRRKHGLKVAGQAFRADDYTYPDLGRALSELSVEHRSVVVLRYLLDWDITATAVALDIPEGTVRSRTSRALESLRGLIGEVDDG